MVAKVQRLPTYVQGLDDRMQGGIPRGSVILVEGGPGSMKSTLTYSILFNNASRAGARGVYLTLEQPRQDLEDQMAGIGFDKSIDPAIDHKLTVIDLGELRRFLEEAREDERRTDWFKSLRNQIHLLHQQGPMDIFVLDSLNALLALHPDSNPRLELFHFIKDLKNYPMTTFLIHEVQNDGLGLDATAGFLTDGIIRMEAKRTDDLVTLQLGVVKMRKTAHEHSFYPLVVQRGGFQVVVR